MKEVPAELHDVKKMFLNGGKGKYEFLKFIFTQKELQSEKPFVLAALAITRLGLEKTDFSSSSFRQWLKRYRVKNKVKQPASTPSTAAEKIPGEKTDNGKNFQLTDPSTLARNEGSLIKYV